MDSREDVLYIIIPAYNEEENIEQCINDWYPVVENNDGGGYSRLVLIDDGSKDNTFSIMQKFASIFPLISPLRKANGGHGQTVLYGYRYAMENGADFIFQTDSDGQTNPAEFDEFWRVRKKYDAVIGYRIERGDGNRRKFVQKIVCILLYFTFGIKVKDANAPFRLMKTTLVSKYIDRLPKDYNLPNIMLTTYFLYYKEDIIFREISFQPRKAGQNSINIKKIIKIGFQALQDFYSFRKDME